jgi:hypothetical protein
MRGLYANMRAEMPNLTAVLGGYCSGGLMTMTSATYRATLDAPHHLFISGSSTAPSAANDSAYPNVARLASSEAFIGAAIADFALHHSWRRVAVVSDATDAWSVESASHFATQFGLRGGEALLAPTYLALHDCSASNTSAANAAARNVLEWLTARAVKIVFVPLNPHCQRTFFAEVSCTRTLSPPLSFSYPHALVFKPSLLTSTPRPPDAFCRSRAQTCSQARASVISSTGSPTRSFTIRATARSTLTRCTACRAPVRRDSSPPACYCKPPAHPPSTPSAYAYVSCAAVRAVGISEASGSGPLYDAYVRLWGARASQQACTAASDATPPFYCDQDNLPNTFATCASAPCPSAHAHVFSTPHRARLAK